jgi:hypothetical protein
MHTIDDVLSECAEKRGLDLRRKKPFYRDFVERHIEEHDLDLDFFIEYGSDARSYTSFNVAVDRLLHFSYLVGKTPIIAGVKGDTREERITSVSQIYLLRLVELGFPNSGGYYQKSLSLKTDQRLFELAMRASARARSVTPVQYPNWASQNDILGQDQEVVRNLGVPITNKMIQKCPSPNPLVHGHGGYRWGRKRKAL